MIKPDPKTVKEGVSIAMDIEGYMIHFNGIEWQRMSTIRVKDWEIKKGFPRKHTENATPIEILDND